MGTASVVLLKDPVDQTHSSSAIFVDRLETESLESLEHEQHALDSNDQHVLHEESASSLKERERGEKDSCEQETEEFLVHEHDQESLVLKQSLESSLNEDEIRLKNQENA